MQKRPPAELVTVRRWQRSATAEGRWGSLTKCGVTESVTNIRVHDGPSCRFVMKFREVVLVPIFQEFKFFEMKTLDDRCSYDGPSYLPSREMKRAVEEIAQVWTTESMTVRRDHDDPSRGPSIQPCLTYFQQIESLFN